MKDFNDREIQERVKELHKLGKSISNNGGLPWDSTAGRLMSVMSKSFIELYKGSRKSNFFWIFCPSIVYREQFENEKELFLKNHADGTVKDFLTFEKKKYSKVDYIRNRSITWHNDDNSEFELDIPDKDVLIDIKVTQGSKYDLILKELEKIKEGENKPEVIEEFKPEEIKRKLEIDNLELNLADRFYILDKVLDMGHLLYQINTSKNLSIHKLLAIMLGCHPDNAKHLLNGTYPTQVNMDGPRKEELDLFISKNYPQGKKG